MLSVSIFIFFVILWGGFTVFLYRVCSFFFKDETTCLIIKKIKGKKKKKSESVSEFISRLVYKLYLLKNKYWVRKLARIFFDLYFLYSFIFLSVIFDLLFVVWGFSLTWYDVAPDFCIGVRSFFEFHTAECNAQFFFWFIEIDKSLKFFFEFFVFLVEFLGDIIIPDLAFDTVHGFSGNEVCITSNDVKFRFERPLIYFNEGNEAGGQVITDLNNKNKYNVYSLSKVEILPYATECVRQVHVDKTEEDILKKFLEDHPTKESLLSLRHKGNFFTYFKNAFGFRLMQGAVDGALGCHLPSDPNAFLYQMDSDIRKVRKEMGWFRYIFEGFIFSDFKIWLAKQLGWKEFSDFLFKSDYERFKSDYDWFVDNYTKYSMSRNALIQFLYDITHVNLGQKGLVVETIEDMINMCTDLGDTYQFRYNVYYTHYMVGRSVDYLSSQDLVSEYKSHVDSLYKRSDNNEVLESEFGNPENLYNYFQFNEKYQRLQVQNFRLNLNLFKNFLETGNTDSSVALREFSQNQGAFLVPFVIDRIESNNQEISDITKVLAQFTHYRNFKYVDHKPLSLPYMWIYSYGLKHHGACRFWSPYYCVNYMWFQRIIYPDVSAAWAYDSWLNHILCQNKNKIPVVRGLNLYRTRYEMVNNNGLDDFSWYKWLLALKPNANVAEIGTLLIANKVFHSFMSPADILVYDQYLIYFLDVFKSMVKKTELLNQSVSLDASGKPSELLKLDNFKLDFGISSLEELQNLTKENLKHLKTLPIYNFVVMLYWDFFRCHAGEEKDWLDKLFGERFQEFVLLKQRLRMYSYKHISNFYVMTSNMRRLYMLDAIANKNTWIRLTERDVLSLGVKCQMPIYQLEPNNQIFAQANNWNQMNTFLEVNASMAVNFINNVPITTVDHSVVRPELRWTEIEVDSFLKNHILDISLEYNTYPCFTRYNIPYLGEEQLTSYSKSAAKPTVEPDYLDDVKRYKDFWRGVFRRGERRFHNVLDPNIFKPFWWYHNSYVREEEIVRFRFVWSSRRQSYVIMFT